MVQVALQEFKDYWANGWHALLFALALVYILICVKEKKVKKTFWWYTGLFVVVFLCPWTSRIITHFIGELVYWRMFWILPTSIIFAFAYTHFYEQLKTKWLKAVAIVAMTLVVAFSGALIYTNIEFVKAPNWHKVSAAVPGICEAIQNDAKERGLQPKAVVVDSLLAEIRQYDAGIKMVYGRNAQRRDLRKHKRRVYEQMQKEIPRYGRLKKSLRILGCNYVVWTGSEESFARFEEKGFRLVGQVDEYKIYFID